MARALAGSACAGSSAAAASGSSTPPYIICASYTGSLSAARKRPEHGAQKGYGEPPRRLSASFRNPFIRRLAPLLLNCSVRRLAKVRWTVPHVAASRAVTPTPVISQQALRRGSSRSPALDGPRSIESFADRPPRDALS